MAAGESELDIATLAGAAGDDFAEPRAQHAYTRSLMRGDVVGRYVVLERLGVGGMGEVYAAYDPELDRKIAIKLLLPGRSDSNSQSSGHARLLREAQAMAKLQHQNVVAVHDVGTHDVRVFVAMEFVDGGNLADWVDAGSDGKGKPHPWPDVLARFIPAGEGLAAAHAAGLIHRDFKPANVLLGRDGSVRVADFGLARQAVLDADAPLEAVPAPSLPPDEPIEIDDRTLPALEHSLTTSRSIKSLSVRMTVTGATLGTPAYMAPEQYSHTQIDARADQFSFCVAVWEALYGQRPYTGDNLHVLMFAIAQANVREPPGDIDVPPTIRRALLRGLQNDPSKRWPDMRALLTELRFDPRARRRKLGLGLLGVGLVAALSVAVIVSRPEPVVEAPVCTGAAAALGDALTPERRAAIAERFAGFDHAWSSDVGERLLPRLDAWTQTWQAAWTDACEATHVRAEQSPELLDRRLTCLDRQRRGFIKLIDGLANADEQLARKADGLLAEIGSIAACSDVDELLRITPMPDDPERAKAIIAADEQLSDAHGLYVGGRISEARTLLETQREVVAALDYAPLAATYEHLRGQVAISLDGFTSGEPVLERAFALALEAGEDRRAALIVRSLAHELQEIDRTAESARWLMIAAALVERLDDDELRGRVEIARSQLLASTGDYAGAEASATAAYELLRRAVPGNARVGDALYLMGLASHRAGRYPETIERVELARAAWSADIGPRHPRTVSGLSLLGVTARATGDYAAAERYFREGMAIQQDTYGANHIDATSHMMNLGIVLGDLGRYDEGIALVEQVLAIRRATPDASAAWTGRTLVNLAQMQRQAGRLEQAHASIEEGGVLLGGTLGEDHPDLVVIFHIRAVIELERGELEQAERSITEALRIARREHGVGSPHLFEPETDSARIALARNKPQLAATRLVTGPAPDTRPDYLGEREFVEAQIAAALGRDDEALAAAERARQAFERNGPGSAERLAEVVAWLAARE